MSDEVRAPEYPAASVPEIEGLIPEERESQRRRRRRLAVLWGAPLLVVALLASLALVGVIGRSSTPTAPTAPTAPTFPGEIGPGWSPSLSTANVPTHATRWPAVELIGLSCPAKGECVAVGDVRHGSDSRAVVVQQRGGTWSAPQFVGSPSESASTSLGFVSCLSDGDCIASTGHNAGSTELLVSRIDAKWSSNHQLPRLGASGDWFQKATACSTDGQCWLLVVELLWATCPAAHPTCEGHPQSWIYAIGEKGARWSALVRLGGPSFRFDARTDWGGQDAQISCSQSSSCEVAGIQLIQGDPVNFVQREVGGVWGRALPVDALDKSTPRTFRIAWGLGVDPPIACTSSRTCLVAGSLRDGTVGAVDQELDGRWLTPVSGIGVSGSHVQAKVVRVACHTRSICVAAGYSSDAKGNHVVTFTQVEVDGHWLRPQLLRGLGNTGNGAVVVDAKCPTSSTCDVVGQFSTTDSANGRTLSFEASYSGSHWHYWIVSLGGAPDETILQALSCAGGECWVTGTVYSKHELVPLEGVVFPFMAPLGSGSGTTGAPTGSSGPTSSPRVNPAVASCESDAQTVNVAVQVWSAQHTGSRPATSSTWRTALVGESKYLVSWPEGKQYAISVASDHAPSDSGDKVKPADGDVLVTVKSTGLTYDFTQHDDGGCATI